MREADPKRALEPTLKAYRRLVDAIPSGPSEQRVRRRLQASLQQAPSARSRRRTALWLAAAVVTAGALVVLAQRWLPARSAAPQVIAGFAVEDSRGLQVQIRGDATIAITAGRGRLADADLALDVTAGTQLRREPLGVRLVRGRVRVTARHRAPSERPARVLVSRGRIEVMGTRFTVIERGQSGQVRLEQGAIRFVAADGRFVTLAPGQSYRWPASPGTAAPAAARAEGAEPSTPPPSAVRDRGGRRAASDVAPPVPAVDVGQVLEEVSALRDQRRYEQAFDAIEQALRGQLAEPTRERLIYEAGALLTDQIGDRARACRYWSEHLSLLSRSGRYAQELQAAWRKLRCSSLVEPEAP